MESQQYLEQSFSEASAVVGAGRQNRLTFSFYLTVACLRPGSCQTPGLKGSPSLILPSSWDFKDLSPCPSLDNTVILLFALPGFPFLSFFFFFLCLSPPPSTSGWPKTCYVDQARLKFRDQPVFVFVRGGMNGVNH